MLSAPKSTNKKHHPTLLFPAERKPGIVCALFVCDMNVGLQWVWFKHPRAPINQIVNRECFHIDFIESKDVKA
jgi:hypothetical protein